MHKNLSQRLLAAMDGYARQTCFQIKPDRRYESISYRQFQRLTFRLVKFLRQQGISGGERLAIVAENSLSWMAACMAGWLAGGVVVPLRTSLTPEILAAVLQDSGSRLAILQYPAHVEAVLPQVGSDLPHLKTVLIANAKEAVPPGTLSVEALLSEAMPLSEAEADSIRDYVETINPHDLAVIHYVSSQSGQPKGAMFDHAQMLAAMGHLAAWFTFEEDDLAFTTPSWSEAPNLNVGLHYFLSGVANVLPVSPETVMEDMQQTSPTVMLSLPYGSELFYRRFMNWISQQPESNQEVFRWALAKGKEYRLAGASASAKLRQDYARANMTFFSHIRGQMGGRMRRSYSTGASLSQELTDFFEAIGLYLPNVYSLTEAGGFPAVSEPGIYRPGSCGRVAPGFEIKISEEGEILARGETVMRGYWQRPQETAEAVNPERWLHSGDIGYFDEEGYLHITGRKRHLLVLSTGHKIFPTVIENALIGSRFITQAAVVGEGKPYISAMIVPDLAALADHFKDVTDNKGRPVMTTAHPKVKELLDIEIGQVNGQLDRWEQVREYSLLDQPLSQEAGELTASMKISRHVVAERYAGQIEAMYPASVSLRAKDMTQVQTDPERMRELLEKESILDAWMADAGIEFLFELARSKQIDAPSMVNICDIAASIAQMENEEKPLSTALIVGDPVRIGRILPVSEIQLLQQDHIRRMSKPLVTLARMVDGLVLGYVVDKYGYVRGIHKLKLKFDHPDDFLLGPQFRHHAAISKQCDAVVFFVPAGGRQVQVFSNGQLIGRYANGDWWRENMSRVSEIITRLTQERGYDLALVRRILRVAFQMSEENLGAIFIIGDANAVLQRSDTSEISHSALILSAEIDKITDPELISFAKQDGATVIDASGRFSTCMVFLRPEATTQAEIGPGKGARHSSAAKMSAEAGCLAITVSHDGPITVYESGRRVLSL